MNIEEKNAKRKRELLSWQTRAPFAGKELDEITFEQRQEFVDKCFETYEKAGFRADFKASSTDMAKYNGMPFKVIGRATYREVDIEAMPMFKVRFENGDISAVFPDEISDIDTW